MARASNDRPILNKTDDLLSRSSFASRLCRTLIDAETRVSSGVVVGISGPWGSGKSSVLNLIYNELTSEFSNAIVVRFDPWLVSGREQLVRSLIAEIENSLAEKSKSKRLAIKVTKALATYSEFVGEFASEFLPYGKQVGTAIKSAGKNVRRDKSLELLRKSVGKGLRELNVPIVVLIDEIDRLDPVDARTMAQLVKAVVDFPAISYVLAYDAERLAEALGTSEKPEERRHEGARYLEKIVQYQISIPLALKGELGQLLDDEVGNIPDGITGQKIITTARYQQLREIVLGQLITTPRDIKRISGTFKVISPMVSGEVDPVDILGFSILSAKVPKAIDSLRLRPETFVIDPIDKVVISSRAIASIGQSPYPKPYGELIGAVESPQSASALLEFLFPAIADRDSDSQSESLFRSNRIGYRRPLLTLLRLGLLPGAISGQVVEGFFNSGVVVRAALLRSLSESQEFPAAYDRLTDIYLGRPGVDDLNFWIAVSQFLKKPNLEWTQDYTSFSNFGRSFAALYIDAVRRKPEFKKVSQEIFGALIEAEDMEIVPRVLRSHAMQYGLFDWIDYQIHDDGLFLSVSQTKSHTIELSKKWLGWHLAGQLIPRCWAIDPILAMIDCNVWNAECRDAVTKILSDPLAVDSISLMMFGGDQAIGRSTVDRILDRDAFLKKIEKRRQGGGAAVPALAVRRAMEKAASNHY